jgi:hypothetical protein
MSNKPFIQIVKGSISAAKGFLVFLYQMPSRIVVLIKKILVELWIVLDSGRTREEKKPQEEKGAKVDPLLAGLGRSAHLFTLPF